MSCIGVITLVDPFSAGNVSKYSQLNEKFHRSVQFFTQLGIFISYDNFTNLIVCVKLIAHLKFSAKNLCIGNFFFISVFLPYTLLQMFATNDNVIVHIFSKHHVK